MIGKKTRIFLTTLILVAIGISVWLGVKERWQIQGMISDPDMAAKSTEELKTEFDKSSNQTIGAYNLAVMLYQQKKYAEAKDILKELLNSKKIGNQETRQVLYNLGNSLYRMSESEEDLSEAIKLLNESLIYFRAIIEKEKLSEKYSSSPVDKDTDAQHNYVFVRKKLKILQDRLAQQKKEQQESQMLYQLIKDLREKEESIVKQLDEMASDPYSLKTQQKRKELLKTRKQNQEQLEIILKKVVEALSAQQNQAPQPPPQANTI